MHNRLHKVLGRCIRCRRVLYTRTICSFPGYCLRLRTIHPESQSAREIWPAYEVIMTKMMMKPIMKLLWKLFQNVQLCMKGWDPEFEPSIEEIVDYQWYNYGDSLSSLSLASSYSGMISLFSLAHGRSKSRPAIATRPNIMQYEACAVCRYACDVSEIDNGH